MWWFKSKTKSLEGPIPKQKLNQIWFIKLMDIRHLWRLFDRNLCLGSSDSLKKKKQKPIFGAMGPVGKYMSRFPFEQNTWDCVFCASHGPAAGARNWLMALESLAPEAEALAAGAADRDLREAWRIDKHGGNKYIYVEAMVVPTVGWLLEWLFGGLVGWLVAWLGPWLNGWLVGWLAGWLVGW